ncbi:MAG: ATP-dependent protease ATPase subunit HslU [Fusobacterium perfoetens]|uniref:ATP-dependent protease ATPase subunit HslU n=1 Tax=Fusobacterium perfoetens TaxID=852 RepID=UPI0023F2F5CC|nr:ATP-dependent protease ATPase subunit HslU [Fusobacterium perfoetens]MCI6151849.1 ATP-dependent protease ATPase subunit HslU [Fusobacterium perfoetens]MDY3236790.1 ATP-dependent protease ATPase subunit HslU [Fusobacterium perfoetens]
MIPSEIVKELDKYIVSQDEAKRNLAISLRNRYRRKNIKDKNMREEITPKNIILMGSTGVGKTELARRLAKITKSPFLKVEATKYTEVGYVGKDVESIIKDIVSLTVKRFTSEKTEELKEKYYDMAVEEVAKKINNLDTLDDNFKFNLIEEIKKGNYNEETIELDKSQYEQGNKSPIIEIMGYSEKGDIGDIIQNVMSMGEGRKGKKSKVKVKEAINLIINKEIEENLDYDEIGREAVKKVENDGIIFIDEIDKIAGTNSVGRGEVSRQGVQRDILPIIEGTTVMTKYGPVRTEHILFIAAGAFSEASFSDLMPELQGRFPLVVSMEDLTKEDFVKILTTVDYNLIEQYKSLLLVDNVEINFTKSAIDKIAEYAYEQNCTVENIGARRLAAVIELILRDIMFEAPYKEFKKINIDKKMVDKIIKNEKEDENLDKYIL